jgi:hypothetical protein
MRTVRGDSDRAFIFSYALSSGAMCSLATLIRQGSHGLTRSHVSRVLRVIIEILMIENPIFVSDQPVRLDLRRIELDLDFNVFGHGNQRRPISSKKTLRASLMVSI